MSRTSMTQKQYPISKRNDLTYGFSLEQSSLTTPHIIKTMMGIIQTESKDSMDVKTQLQFSRIADAVVRMAEEIRA